MKKIILGLSLAALAAGSAYAVESQRPNPDRDGNGILTRAEAEARSAQMFARMDANKDGKLDPADREARRAAHFDAIDANKDGQISRAEFTAPRERRGMGEGRGPGMERRKGGHHRGGMMRGPMMQGMADTDKDGAITQAEFTAAALRRFDRTDVNKDGQVTREERQAQRNFGRQRGAPPAPPAS